MTAHPNSRWSRFRYLLAQWIEPTPDPGESWCVDCSLNSGRTLVLPADSIIQHARRNHIKGEREHIIIKAAWPHRKEGGVI
jgi:hypothetical protein